MTKVGIISDLHMRNEYDDRILEELNAVVRNLNERDGLAHVFVLGDLVDDCGSLDADRENLRRIRSVIEGISVPVTYLLGNHDVDYLTKDKLGSILEQDAFYGVEEIAGTSFVYLDSTCERGQEPAGRLGPEQMEWLEETLPALSDAIALVHHPVGNFDLRDNPWFAPYPEQAYLWDRKQVLEQFETSAAVRGTISGHIHTTAYDDFRGVPHVSINAFSRERPDIPLTGTYGVLTVDEQPRIEIQTPSEAVATHYF